MPDYPIRTTSAHQSELGWIKFDARALAMRSSKEGLLQRHFAMKFAECRSAVPICDPLIGGEV